MKITASFKTLGFLVLFLILSAYGRVLAEETFKIIPGRVFQVDSEGNFFISAGNNSISKYSPDGKFLLEIGRAGEGPSDIKRLGWFALHPKTEVIYVTESFGGNRWISRFSKNGNYLGEWNCELDWSRYDGLSFINFDNNENVYIQTVKSHYQRNKEFSLGTIENQVLKFSPEGKKLKEIYKFNADFNAEKGGKGNITLPFINYLYWTIYGDRIIIRENRDDFIRVLDTDGNLVKKISLPFKRDKIEEKDIDEWESQMKLVRWVKQGIAEGWFDLKYWRKRLPYPEYKPVSGGQMFIDSHGYLYSWKYPGYKMMENKWVKINMATFDLQVVQLNPGEKIISIWKDYFFLTKIDDDDDESVIIKIHEKDILKTRSK